jgi:hypothetical protein
MKGLRYLGFLAVMFLGVGCVSTSQKQSAAISRGIYAEHAAMVQGRFDLAAHYDEQLTRLVPPPKRAPVVHNFTTHGQTYAVLPQAFQSVPTVAVGSALFNTALGNDKSLQGHLNDDGKALDEFSKAADKIVRARDVEVAKFEAREPTVGKRILHWLLGLSIPILIAGVVCLCVFCPVCIPFVIASVRFVLHLGGSFIRALGKAIGEIETILEKRSPPSG